MRFHRSSYIWATVAKPWTDVKGAELLTNFVSAHRRGGSIRVTVFPALETVESDPCWFAQFAGWN